jgi:cell division protein FtsB
MSRSPEITTPATPVVRRKDGPDPLRRKQIQPAAGLPRWRRGLNFLLVFVTIVLVVDALIGEKGLVETMRARRQSRDVAASVERLRIENARLRELIGRLHGDAGTIESIARRELGLIRPGEVLFILKDIKPAQSRQPAED